jgi:hypothetical protein
LDLPSLETYVQYGTVLARGAANDPLCTEAHIRTLVYSLIGVAAVAAGVLLIRQQKQVAAPKLREIPGGENAPRQFSLEHLRELGY